MFSGIVVETGVVKEINRSDNLLRFVVECEKLLEGRKIGDSVAINGVCLTVVEIADGCLSFDVIKETIDLTNLKYLSVGGRVNMETSLRLADTIDGHLVQGHVDCVAKVEKFSVVEGATWLWVSVPTEIERFIAYKGSVCLNGVSLTVAGIEGDRIGVSLIPHTLEITNLGQLAVGDFVNLEVDMLARYLDRLIIK
ncbi:riboflavin synthase [Candidatus Peregrinibacteria bacterium HGW-Peregrinibacteria-1]|jgi:riboflavin synthase|nr:MAG: riboflavin synthase [Candidatus Peregrinibacteria bacterium HGW-Peregrinibacteria-1]